MRVGLIAVDSIKPNLALMKISAWHKAKGDSVCWYTPVGAAFEPFDKVYASKVFTFTPDYQYMPSNAICGGSGYDNNIDLATEIEHCAPDYDLYQMKYSLGFSSRGCSRSCGFCIVPEKEGMIREHSPLSEFVRHKKVELSDNNFLASPKAEEKLLEMIDQKLVVDFNQGLDIRLMTKRFAELIVKLNPPRLRFAWDHVGMESVVRAGVNLLKEAGYPIRRQRVSFYVLCNFKSEFTDDLYRVQVLRSLDISPFVMVYNKSKAIRHMRELASWCNHPSTFQKYKEFNEWLTIRKLPPWEVSV